MAKDGLSAQIKNATFKTYDSSTRPANETFMPKTAIYALTLGTVMLAIASAGAAERIENGVAVFSALDKVTATIKKLEVPLGETTVFGALKVTPRVCYSRPPTEQPKTTSFVQVDEVQLDGKQTSIFSGWMFAESPGLNAVEHPVFDVWLTGCGKPKNAVAAKVPSPIDPANPGAASAARRAHCRRAAETAREAVG